MGRSRKRKHYSNFNNKNISRKIYYGGSDVNSFINKIYNKLSTDLQGNINLNENSFTDISDVFRDVFFTFNKDDANDLLKNFFGKLTLGANLDGVGFPLEHMGRYDVENNKKYIKKSLHKETFKCIKKIVEDPSFNTCDFSFDIIKNMFDIDTTHVGTYPNFLLSVNTEISNNLLIDLSGSTQFNYSMNNIYKSNIQLLDICGDKITNIYDLSNEIYKEGKKENKEEIIEHIKNYFTNFKNADFKKYFFKQIFNNKTDVSGNWKDGDVSIIISNKNDKIDFLNNHMIDIAGNVFNYTNYDDFDFNHKIDNSNNNLLKNIFFDNSKNINETIKNIILPYRAHTITNNFNFKSFNDIFDDDDLLNKNNNIINSIVNFFMSTNNHLINELMYLNIINNTYMFSNMLPMNKFISRHISDILFKLTTTKLNNSADSSYCIYINKDIEDLSYILPNYDNTVKQLILKGQDKNIENIVFYSDISNSDSKPTIPDKINKYAIQDYLFKNIDTDISDVSFNEIITNYFQNYYDTSINDRDVKPIPTKLFTQLLNNIDYSGNAQNTDDVSYNTSCYDDDISGTIEKFQNNTFTIIQNLSGYIYQNNEEDPSTNYIDKINDYIKPLQPNDYKATCISNIFKFHKDIPESAVDYGSSTEIFTKMKYNNKISFYILNNLIDNCFNDCFNDLTNDQCMFYYDISSNDYVENFIGKIKNFDNSLNIHFLNEIFPYIHLYKNNENNITGISEKRDNYLNKLNFLKYNIFEIFIQVNNNSTNNIINQNKFFELSNNYSTWLSNDKFKDIIIDKLVKNVHTQNPLFNQQYLDRIFLSNFENNHELIFNFFRKIIDGNFGSVFLENPKIKYLFQNFHIYIDYTLQKINPNKYQDFLNLYDLSNSFLKEKLKGKLNVPLCSVSFDDLNKYKRIKKCLDEMKLIFYNLKNYELFNHLFIIIKKENICSYFNPFGFNSFFKENWIILFDKLINGSTLEKSIYEEAIKNFFLNKTIETATTEFIGNYLLTKNDDGEYRLEKTLKNIEDYFKHINNKYTRKNFIKILDDITRQDFDDTLINADQRLHYLNYKDKINSKINESIDKESHIIEDERDNYNRVLFNELLTNNNISITIPTKNDDYGNYKKTINTIIKVFNKKEYQKNKSIIENIYSKLDNNLNNNANTIEFIRDLIITYNNAINDPSIKDYFKDNISLLTKQAYESNRLQALFEIGFKTGNFRAMFKEFVGDAAAPAPAPASPQRGGAPPPPPPPAPAPAPAPPPASLTDERHNIKLEFIKYIIEHPRSENDINLFYESDYIHFIEEFLKVDISKIVDFFEINNMTPEVKKKIIKKSYNPGFGDNEKWKTEILKKKIQDILSDTQFSTTKNLYQHLIKQIYEYKNSNEKTQKKKKVVNITITQKIKDYYDTILHQENDIFGFSFTDNKNKDEKLFTPPYSGILITSIHLEKLFALNGLKPGDIITKINNVKIKDSDDLKHQFVSLISIPSQEGGANDGTYTITLNETFKKDISFIEFKEHTIFYNQDNIDHYEIYISNLQDRTKKSGLKENMIIEEISGVKMRSDEQPFVKGSLAKTASDLFDEWRNNDIDSITFKVREKLFIPKEKELSTEDESDTFELSNNLESEPPKDFSNIRIFGNYIDIGTSEELVKSLNLKKLKPSINIEYIEGNINNISTFILDVSNKNNLNAIFKQSENFIKIDSLSEESILSILGFNKENVIGRIELIYQNDISLVFYGEDSSDTTLEKPSSDNILRLNNKIKNLTGVNKFIINFQNKNEHTNKQSYTEHLQERMESRVKTALVTGKEFRKKAIDIGKSFTALVGINSDRKKTRKEAGELYFEEIINQFLLYYGLDFDEKDTNTSKRDIFLGRNKEIIVFFDKYGISKMLSKKIMVTQTSFFSVSTSDAFDANKELEFIKKRKLQIIKDKYEKIKKKENISERNEEIKKLLKETKEMEDGSIQNSEEFKKLLDKQRTLFLNDASFKASLDADLEEIRKDMDFNREEGIKRIELMEKEGRISAMERQLLLEKYSILDAANKSNLKSNDDTNKIYQSYSDWEKQMLNLQFTDFELASILQQIKDNPEITNLQTLKNNTTNKETKEKLSTNDEQDIDIIESFIISCIKLARSEEVFDKKKYDEVVGGMAEEAAAAAEEAGWNVAAKVEVVDLHKERSDQLVGIKLHDVEEYPKLKIAHNKVMCIIKKITQKTMAASTMNVGDLILAINGTPCTGPMAAAKQLKGLVGDFKVEILRASAASDAGPQSQNGGAASEEGAGHDTDSVDYVDGGGRSKHLGGASTFDTISNIKRVNDYFIGGAPKTEIEVDKRQSGNMNFNEEEIYELTHYMVQIIWNLYVILTYFIKKKSLVNKFMIKYIKTFFDRLNSKKINTIVSGIDTYKSVSEILINKVFLDIIKNDITKTTDDIQFEHENGIEKQVLEKLSREESNLGLIAEETDKTSFMKIAFKQTDIINFLINNLNDISELGKTIMKEGGIELIENKYKIELKKILNIIESKEDLTELTRCINKELNNIFIIEDETEKNINILNVYREKINTIDRYIDNFESINIEELYTFINKHIQGFKLNDEGITFETKEFEQSSIPDSNTFEKLESKRKKLEIDLDAINKQITIYKDKDNK